ncbi:hypothetical protein LINPERPRIM_LOCUS18485 [Linum perenne]
MNESAAILESRLPLDIFLKIASSLPVLLYFLLSYFSLYYFAIFNSVSSGKRFSTFALSAAALASGGNSAAPIQSGSRSPAGDGPPQHSSPILLRYGTFLFCSSEGWKEFYVEKHGEMAGRAGAVVEIVNLSCGTESMEVGDYLKAIRALTAMELTFGDVQMILFKPNLSVLINLVALHYCIFCLQSPAWEVVEALRSCKIAERQVCIKWWKLGRWFYGFRMRDESHSRQVSLEEIVTDDSNELFGVLHRGAIHEVLRVLICVATVASIPWPMTSSNG